MRKSSKKIAKAITLDDRISDLPEAVLWHILSFLPTKQVVATCILAKRWEFLWTYVDILELSNNTKGKVQAKMHFVQFVYKILQLLRTPLIKKMVIRDHYGGCNEYDVVTWIQTAVSKNIEALHLGFSFKFNFPRCLFYSQTLVELFLYSADITKMNIPTAPLFPNLRRLYLNETKCKTDSLKRLISGCSILEYFHLELQNHLVKTCDISSATLRTVELLCSPVGKSLKLVLNTPALECLRIWHMRKLEVLVECSMPSFNEAEITFYSSMLHYCLRCLECISNVKSLRIEAEDYNMVSRGIKQDLHADFSDLTRLRIEAHKCCLDLLRSFMEKANNLIFIDFVKIGSSNDPIVIWEVPEHVPKCLLSSLEMIRIETDKDEVEIELMIKYILGNAKVLQLMEIHISTPCFVRTNFKLEFHMRQKISMFPRASAICEVSFK